MRDSLLLKDAAGGEQFAVLAALLSLQYVILSFVPFVSL